MKAFRAGLEEVRRRANRRFRPSGPGVNLGRRVACFFTLLVVLVSARPASAQMAAAEPAILRPGDLLRIDVWRRPELTGEFTVNADSTLDHPLYRQVKIAGVPIRTVEARIREFLTGLEANPQFAIRPQVKVTVGGEVGRPDLYTFPLETTIAQALALAGGATERGRLDRVQFSRGGRTIALDLTRPEAEVANETVRSGDQIMLLRRGSFFREVVVPAASLIAAVTGVIRVFF